MTTPELHEALVACMESADAEALVSVLHACAGHRYAQGRGDSMALLHQAEAVMKRAPLFASRGGRKA